MNEQYVEKQLEITEDRLNDHAERIRNLEKDQAITNTQIDNLCDKIEKQTKSINALIGTFATALLGFFFYCVQQGLFK